MATGPAMIPVDAGHPDALSINGTIGLLRGQVKEPVHLLDALTVDGLTTLSGGLVFAGNLAVAGDLSVSGTTTLGDAITDTVAIAGVLTVAGVTTLSGNLLFSPDNTKDIGASGATRPRDLFLGRNAVIGGTLGVTGTATMAAISSSGQISTTVAGLGLNVSNNANIGGTLAVGGAVTVTVAGLGLSVTNNATVGGTLGVTGTLTASNALTVGGLISANGGQIAFPAAQTASADANTLDDYEEGTWTPSVGGTATYTTQTGRYTKVGRTVIASFQMSINSIVGAATTNAISGLPFTPASTALGAASYWSGLSIAIVQLSFIPSGTSLLLYSAGAAATGLSNSGILTTGSEVRGFLVFDV